MHPRHVAVQKIRAVAEPLRFNTNATFLADLLADIRQHRVFRHPVVAAMYAAELGPDALIDLHLDFRVLTRQFTDVILMAQFHTREIDRRHNEDHMPARFLLGLNMLDELGFRPGQGTYLGNPDHSHFRLYEQHLDRMGVPREGRSQRAGRSPAVLALHDSIEASLGDFLFLLVYLVVAEEVVMIYSPAMRAANEAAGLMKRDGYYHVHGSSLDHDTEADRKSVV